MARSDSNLSAIDRSDRTTIARCKEIPCGVVNDAAVPSHSSWRSAGKERSGIGMSKTHNQLVGKWLHSHEEDTAKEMVYRRDDFDFPPSRGRNGYEFRANKTCNYIGIAPQDGSTLEGCEWKVTGRKPKKISLSFVNGKATELDVVSIEKDRLVIRRP